VAAAEVSRRAPWSRGCSRLAEESLISSSWISSHWASVRWLSGIARSSCRRARGDIGCGAFMAALSHRSTSAAPPTRGELAAATLGKDRVLTDGPLPTLSRRPGRPGPVVETNESGRSACGRAEHQPSMKSRARDKRLPTPPRGRVKGGPVVAEERRVSRPPFVATIC